MSKSIDLFMWPFQHSYRGVLKYLAESVLKEIGLPTEVKALLVGVRRPDHKNRNAICIEPEYNEWPLSLFDGIADRIETVYQEHPLHSMFYENDERAMAAKPENARRDSIRQVVKSDLAAFDEANNVASFVGSPRPVGDFHVTPVVQVQTEAIQSAPRVEPRTYLERYTMGGSFLDYCMSQTMAEATLVLEADEPGRSNFDDRRSASEIVQRAAVSFMRIVAYNSARQRELGDAIGIELFSTLNELSALRYERIEGVGQIVFDDPTRAELRYAMKLEAPVSFRQIRHARKLLEMSSAEMPLIANGAGIHGLLKLEEADVPRPDRFSANVMGTQSWQLRYGDVPIIRTVVGKPKLPLEIVSRERFIENYMRVVAGASRSDAGTAAGILGAVYQLDRGCMVVFASDALEEVRRLGGQGMPIEPALLDERLLDSASRIDGSILVDQSGRCHALGVILDGEANENCDPSRGSRYNSAVRYVAASTLHRLAIVRSDDGTVDVVPLLHPRIEHRLIDEALAALEVATAEDYHKPRLFLDRHRFYLTPQECLRGNNALHRLENLPKGDYSIMIITPRFSPDPEMNASYYI